MSIDRIGFLHSFCDFSTFDKNHEIDFFELTNVKLVSDRLGFKLCHGNRVSDIFNSVLREQNLDDLDLGLEPE